MIETKQHILGIGPTHWMGEGPFRIVDSVDPANNFLVVHCGDSDAAYRGVAIVVSSELQPAVTSCDFVSNRIVSVDLNAWLYGDQRRPGTVIQVYVPRNDNVKIEHDTFWQQLKHLVDCKLMQGRWVLLMGSANTCDIHYIRCNLDVKTSCNFHDLSTPGHGSTVCLIKALIRSRSPTSADGCRIDETNAINISIISAGFCRVETLYEYELCAGQIDWLDEAKVNNQPSAAHASVYTVQSQQQVVKLTNNVEIVRHMRHLLEPCIRIVSELPNLIQFTPRCPIKIGAHLCANASADWREIDLSLANGGSFLTPLPFEWECEYSNVYEFEQEIYPLDGFLIEVTDTRLIVEWGGMPVGMLCWHPRLGRLLWWHLKQLLRPVAAYFCENFLFLPTGNMNATSGMQPMDFKMQECINNAGLVVECVIKRPNCGLASSFWWNDFFYGM